MLFYIKKKRREKNLCVYIIKDNHHIIYTFFPIYKTFFFFCHVFLELNLKFVCHENKPDSFIKNYLHCIFLYIKYTPKREFTLYKDNQSRKQRTTQETDYCINLSTQYYYNIHSCYVLYVLLYTKKYYLYFLIFFSLLFKG